MLSKKNFLRISVMLLGCIVLTRARVDVEWNLSTRPQLAPVFHNVSFPSEPPFVFLMMNYSQVIFVEQHISFCKAFVSCSQFIQQGKFGA